MLIRVKPYNKKRGCLVQRYTCKGTRYEARLGWYEVDDATAKYLATVHQIDGDVDSPKVFDVMSKEEAIKMEKVEAAMGKASPAETPKVLTPKKEVVEKTEPSKIERKKRSKNVADKLENI